MTDARCVSVGRQSVHCTAWSVPSTPCSASPVGPAGWTTAGLRTGEPPAWVSVGHTVFPCRGRRCHDVRARQSVRGTTGILGYLTVFKARMQEGWAQGWTGLAGLGLILWPIGQKPSAISPHGTSVVLPLVSDSGSSGTPVGRCACWRCDRSLHVHVRWLVTRTCRTLFL